MTSQEEGKDPMSVQSELNEVWRELLGDRPANGNVPTASGEAVIPTLESDPWSELLHAKGVEIVDLQKVHLQMSDQDLEQMLAVMQEQPAQDTQGIDKRVTDNQ